MHAIIVGSDITAQRIFESQLRDFVRAKKIQDRVHFVNKTITVAPYLSAIDIFVQNSQVGFLCFSILLILLYFTFLVESLFYLGLLRCLFFLFLCTCYLIYCLQT